MVNSAHQVSSHLLMFKYSFDTFRTYLNKITLGFPPVMLIRFNAYPFMHNVCYKRMCAPNYLFKKSLYVVCLGPTSNRGPRVCLVFLCVVAEVF